MKKLWKENVLMKKEAAPEEITALDREWNIDIKYYKAFNGKRGYAVVVKNCGSYCYCCVEESHVSTSKKGSIHNFC